MYDNSLNSQNSKNKVDGFSGQVVLRFMKEIKGQNQNIFTEELLKTNNYFTGTLKLTNNIGMN